MASEERKIEKFFRSYKPEKIGVSKESYLLSDEPGDIAQYTEFCNESCDVEETEVLPALVLESLTGSTEVFLGSEEEHEYQTLQPAAVVETDMEMTSKIFGILIVVLFFI